MLQYSGSSIGEPIVNGSNLYVNGFQLVTSSQTTLQIYSGICRDSTNTFDIYLPPVNSTTPFTTLNMAVTGVNGQDQSIVASGTTFLDVENLSIGIFVIADSTGFKPTATIASINFINNANDASTQYASEMIPIMPFGYDIFRRIGWASTTPVAGGFNIIYQSGNNNYRQYQFDVPIQFINTTEGTVVPQAFGSSAQFTLYNCGYYQDPRCYVNNTTFGVLTPGPVVTLNGTYTPASAGNQLFIAAPVTGTAISLANSPIIVQGQVMSQALSFGSQRIMTAAGGTQEQNITIIYVASTSSGDVVLLSISGFEDYI